MQTTPPSIVSGTDVEEISSALQSCLDAACLWIQVNGLKLNSTKSKCMLIHSSSRKCNLPPLDLHLLGSQIEQVSSFKFLGIIINNTLTWSDHVKYILQKVSRSISLLRRLSWFLPRSLLVLFLKSYILPVLDYCDVVWDSCTKKEAQRMETLLNYACRVVLHRQKHESATAARAELGLTTLAVRRKIHLARLMYKCTHSQQPPYLASLFPLPSSHHQHFTRSSSTVNLPPVRSSFGKRAFSFAGASLWRTLPPAIRNEKSWTVFNSSLLEYFNHHYLIFLSVYLHVYFLLSVLLYHFCHTIIFIKLILINSSSVYYLFICYILHIFICLLNYNIDLSLIFFFWLIFILIFVLIIHYWVPCEVASG